MQDHVSQIRDNVQQFGLTCTLDEILRENRGRPNPRRRRRVLVGSSRGGTRKKKENSDTDYCNKANLKLSKIR